MTFKLNGSTSVSDIETGSCIKLLFGPREESSQPYLFKRGQLEFKFNALFERIEFPFVQPVTVVELKAHTVSTVFILEDLFRHNFSQQFSKLNARAPTEPEIQEYKLLLEKGIVALCEQDGALNKFRPNGHVIAKFVKNENAFVADFPLPASKYPHIVPRNPR